MNFSLAFSGVSILSSLTLSFGTGLNTGGPEVLVWSWIIVSIFNLFVGLSLAEICSVYPTAGGVYNWAFMLSPKKWAPSVCYITGWFNFLGKATGEASDAYGFATLIAAVYALKNGS